MSKSLKDQLYDVIDVTVEEAIAKVRHGISQSINTIAQDTRNALQNTGYRVNSPMPEGGTLMEGIRAFLYRRDSSDYIHGVVHILGNRNTNDGTWRLRFFEGGTQDRWQKKGNKRNLTKVKYLGSLPSKWFFRDSIQNAEQKTANIINNLLKDINIKK